MFKFNPYNNINNTEDTKQKTQDINIKYLNEK